MKAPGYAIGDCIEVLRALPAEWAHCCVTSPPYWGLRDYGHGGQIGREETPEAYVARLVGVFREVRRVLRDDGTLWLNLGDSYVAGRPGRCVGDSMRASTLTGRGRSGKGGPGITRDASCGRPQRGFGDLKPKDLVGIPWRVAFALQADGWYLRSDIIWAKPNPMPESVTDRPTKAHEYVFLLSKNARYYYDADAVRERSVDAESISAESISGYNRKISTDGAKLCAHDPGYDGHRTRVGLVKLKQSGNTYPLRNKRNVWTVATVPYSGAHFACYPPELIKPCVLAGCPPGGIVLDPFFGSGTTGRVAADCGRSWFGIELNPEYEDLIKARTAQAGLFVGARLDQPDRGR